MEFKYINDRNKTPNSKSRVFSSTNNSNDTSFKFLPSYSTPPSRYTKIVNPFEKRLIDRLHLPTFSPSVFATVSTPKTEEKFVWTIEDISSLKPADIDEATISQHVFEEDPQIESMAQQKIDEFFNDKVIVPSPMVEVVRVPLVTDSAENLFKLTESKEYCDGSTQTVLSLPPVLPPHVEEILKPYFLPAEAQQKTDENDVLIKNLFNFDTKPGCCTDQEDSHSMLSGKGFSPVNSPVRMDRKHSLPFEMPYLADCSLSPIDTKSSPRVLRSACRLDFSSKMSLDASLIVPDVNNMTNNSVVLESSQNAYQIPEQLTESPVNWEMEYRHISFVSPSSSPDSEKMDLSNSNTPNTGLFTSQRKRLSDSFKEDDDDFEKEIEVVATKENSTRLGRKLFKNDLTDNGYHTESINFYDESRTSSHMFASTPTKTQKM
ncbi:uncharacterized protein bora [Diabrotica undecimpunctata]|uniref:uncharacterized protein bora n=1 Tax=Diabrotica undecimpunctata TaxID=50387 RepID=UPI003B6412D4